MPRKQKAQDATNEMKKGQVILNTLMVCMILLFWLAIFGFCIKLDLAGLGTMLRPALGNVPILHRVLPEEITGPVIIDEVDPSLSLQEALARIQELESLNEDLQRGRDEAVDRIAQLQVEVDRLHELESQQIEFEARVKAFDEQVVFAKGAPDIGVYKEFYEKISPDHAASIYEKVIKQLQYDRAVEEKADIFKKMKAKDAAAILEEMTADTEAVAQILLSMEPKYSSEILANMDRINAARITKKMLDLDEELSKQLAQ